MNQSGIELFKTVDGQLSMNQPHIIHLFPRSVLLLLVAVLLWAVAVPYLYGTMAGDNPANEPLSPVAVMVLEQISSTQADEEEDCKIRNTAGEHAQDVAWLYPSEKIYGTTLFSNCPETPNPPPEPAPGC